MTLIPATPRGALLRAGDRYSIDTFAKGQRYQPDAGVIIPAADYTAGDLPPVEFGLLGVQSILFIIDVPVLTGTAPQCIFNLTRFESGRPGAVPPDHGFFLGVATVTITAPGTYFLLMNPWAAAGSSTLGDFGTSFWVQRTLGKQWRATFTRGGTVTAVSYSLGLHTI